jgi:hypothetical protein
MNYLNQWHRYTMVYASGLLTAYVDGQVAGTANGSIGSTAGNAGMGIHWWCNNPYGVSTRLTGSLADVRIYNRALSPNEIAKLAQTSSPVQTPPGQTTPPQIAEALTPLSVDDIKALTAAGVNTNAIIHEIDISQSKYSPQDIAAAQQANPPIEPTVIAYMQNHSS